MDLKSISSSCGYSVRKLGFSDVDIIYNVLKGNTLYYEYHPPFVTKESIIDDIKALPPGKSYSDKYFIGFFNQEKLYAVKAERVEPGRPKSFIFPIFGRFSPCNTKVLLRRRSTRLCEN